MNWKRRALDHLDEDIRDHIERETAENIERGLSPEDARLAALRKFGNVARTMEDTRDVWNIVWLDQLLQDLRYGFRVLRRNPAFSAIVILTLALGIGVNTAVFSVINSVLLRPLPYREADRIVFLWSSNPSRPREPLSPGRLLDFRRRLFQRGRCCPRRDRKVRGAVGGTDRCA